MLFRIRVKDAHLILLVLTPNFMRRSEKIHQKLIFQLKYSIYLLVIENCCLIIHILILLGSVNVVLDDEQLSGIAYQFTNPVPGFFTVYVLNEVVYFVIKSMMNFLLMTII